MHTLAAVSTGSFVAGGVLAAAGVILAVTAPKSASQMATVSPFVGLGFAGVAGRF